MSAETRTWAVTKESRQRKRKVDGGSNLQKLKVPEISSGFGLINADFRNYIVHTHLETLG